MLREMTGSHGGFFSATDADSEGEEGKYFVWTEEEIEAILGSEEAPIFCRFFGVTQRGQLRRQQHSQHIQNCHLLRPRAGESALSA